MWPLSGVRPILMLWVMPKLLPTSLLELAGRQRGVLLGSQITAEVDDRRLPALVHHGALNRLWQNAYAVPSLSVPTPVPSTYPFGFRNARQHAIGAVTRLTAADLTVGDRIRVVAALDTAAELYGFDIADDPGTHILAGQDWPSHRTGLVHHRPELLRPLTTVAGFSATELTETALRIAARQRHPAKMLAVLDAAVRYTRLTPADLLALASDLRIRHIRPVRSLSALADPGAESPGESWLRWACIDAGFPIPTTQITVLTPSGEFRVDLGWPELRVGCEYEGVEFHTGKALHKDRTKYNALGRAGWLMVGATSHMIWHTRVRLVAEISHYLALRGCGTVGRMFA